MHHSATPPDLTDESQTATKLYVQLLGGAQADAPTPQIPTLQIQSLQQSAGRTPHQLVWLRETDSVPADAALVRVAANALLPPRWLERLLAATRVSGTEQVLTTLCDQHGLRLPRVGQSLNSDTPRIDGLCAALAPETVFAISAQAGALCYVPESRREQFSANEAAPMHLYCGMFVGSSTQNREFETQTIASEQPWYALSDRIDAALKAKISSTLRGDSRPRMLHVLHSWGGGVQRFAEDYARADDSFRHLWLLPKGEAAAKLFGCELCLFDPLDGLVLVEKLISPAIAAVETRHDGYQAILLRICAAYRIERVLVSSTIGHALEVFRTGLPTAVVLHDYFPLWPKLHCDFGDLARRFDETELAQDARDAAPFAAMTPGQWWQRRCAYIAVLQTAKVQLIAPSQSVLRNVLRMAPELKSLNAAVIGHGLAPWSSAQDKAISPLRETSDPNARHKLRVLVPGRLAAGKGADLLLQALPQLLPLAEIWLLGAKEAARAFFACSGVHIIADYVLAELPDLVTRIAPDVALLPRTVAETFSYSLSEMWSLGLPVLATNSGALAERIVEGENGFLCQPDADSLIAALTMLARHPEKIARVRAQLSTRREVTPRDQARAYAALFQVAPESTLEALPMPNPVVTATLEGCYQSRLATAAAAIASLKDSLKASQAQAIERGEWGRRVQDALTQRSAWANEMVLEISRLSDQTLALNAAHAAETEHLKSIITQQQLALQTEILALRALLDAERTNIARLQEELQGARREYQDILASSSWRVTRPMRVLARALKSLKQTLRFQMTRGKTLVRRGWSSLRTRGIAATLQRALRKDAPLQHPVTLELPITPETFASYTVAGTVAADATTVDVSIIVPVYNKFHYTDTCLRALGAAPSRRRVEIIVVDDCSTDNSWENLQQIAGVRAQKNPKNLGFIGACNAGLASARGAFVVYLNNDTAVQAGWLDALIDTFDQRPDAGLVGSMLIYPDGRLQESGGIIFNDGSGWNYGRFADPNDPQYGFVREVDYCSGASIALRKTALDGYGGFDTHYTPAYYEDTDLAFKVRASGLKCYVQPASRVVHFEGVSSGTDLSTGIKRFQVINQQKFLARWGETLKTHPAPPPQTPIAVASQHRARKFILVVDAVTPMPDQDSGSLRMINLLTILVTAGCAVTFFCEGRHYHSGYAEKMQQLGVQVLYHPYLSNEPAWLAENGARFDAVMLSRHYIAAPLLELVRTHCRRARVLFDTVDLHFLREQRQAELSGDAALRRSAEQTKSQELAIISGSDITLVVSPIERDLLKQLLPAARVEILSNIHEVPGCANPFDARADLLFVGGFQHPPNVDAVLWFVDEVWTKVRAALPEVKLHLVGSNTPKEIAKLANDHLIVHGFVPDIDPLLAKSRLSIAPLRYGAGVKGKVNMAMAHGLPVIATNAAVEGMYCENGVDVMVGDHADAFAEALIEAYQNRELWQRLSEGGLRNVSTHFSFAAAKSVIERVFALDAAR